MINFFLSFIFAGIGFALGYPFDEDQFSLLAPIIGNTFFYHALLCYFKNNSIKTPYLLLGTLGSLLIANLIGFLWVPKAINLFSGFKGISAFFVNLSFMVFSYPPIWIFVCLLILFRSPKLKEKIVILFKKYQCHFPLFFAALLVLIDDLIPTIFPIKIGSSWIRIAPYLGLAPFFGLYFYSFLTHFISLEFLKFFHTKRVPSSSLTIFILLTLFHVFFPLKNADSNSQVHIRLVQANIESDIEFLPKRNQRKNWDKLWPRYQAPSEENLPKDLDLLIWPETAYPFPLSSDNPKSYRQHYLSLSKKVNNLIFGGVDKINNKKYVSSFLFSKGKFHNVYHKQKLIPFAETIPFKGALFHKAQHHLPNTNHFSSGEKPTLFDLGNEKTFMTPLCYEILFHDYLRDILNSSPKPVNFLVNMANDAWFRSSREVHQHEFMARWTAMIFQKPIIRSLNTGRSSVITPTGEFTHRLENLSQGVIDARVSLYPKKAPNFYQRWGLNGFLLFIIFLIALQKLIFKLLLLKIS